MDFNSVITWRLVRCPAQTTAMSKTWKLLKTNNAFISLNFILHCNTTTIWYSNSFKFTEFKCMCDPATLLLKRINPISVKNGFTCQWKAPPPPPPPRWERVNWSICYLSSLIAISLPWQLNWLLFLIKVPYYYTIYACVSPSFTNSQNKCKKHSVGNLLHGVMVTFTARGWGNTFVLNGKKRLHKNRFLKGQDTMTHLTVLC